MRVNSQEAIARNRTIAQKPFKPNGPLPPAHAQKLGLFVAFLALLGAFVASPAAAQTYLQDVSVPPVDASVPVEMGYVNLPTGSLNLRIPLGTYPQRGGGTGSLALNYTSNLGYYAAPPLNWTGPSGHRAGWGISTSNGATFGPALQFNVQFGGSCNNIPYDSNYIEYSNFSFTAPDGSEHTWTNDVFYYSPYDPVHCPFTPYGVGSAYDDQGTGYYLSYVTGTAVLFGPDGTSCLGGNIDPNGNQLPGLPAGGFAYFESGSGSYANDTLNRPLIQVTMSGTTEYLAVPNASGVTSTYTLKWQTVNVSTNFGYIVGGNHVPEYSASFQQISEIDLPDGTAYHFTYDSGTTPGHYGEMTSMTLPTGGTISYSYSNSTDYNGQMHRWLTHRTTQDSSTGWSYGTPSGSTTEAITVTSPSGDYSIHTFIPVPSTLPTAMLPTETQYYDVSSSLLGTIWACYGRWTGSQNSCPAISYNDIRLYYKTADITTLAVPGGSVTSMREYTYDCGTGNCTHYGNISKLQEWNFGSSLSGSPDRTTTLTYYNNGYVVNKPATNTVTNSSGALVAKTVNTYDGSSLVTTGATGIVNHDDIHYGSGFNARGNLTQVQRYTSSSSYVTSSMTYDITGQMRTSTDPKGIQTIYSYTDGFFNDAGDNSSPSAYTPSTATNAYLTSITKAYGTPVAETSTFGYYFGTGQMAKTTDPNSRTTYSHFYDSFSRPTSTKFPDSGWTYLVYPFGSETQVDKGTGITSTTLSTTCSSSGNACRHDQTLLDSMGRVVGQNLVSDPGGQTTAATAYDLNGRVQKRSNPYRSTSDSTYGWTTPTYDGLNRVTQTQDPDGSVVYTYYGATVSSHGGRSSQMCSGYGVGYPLLDVDEAGKLRQTWIDGFGRLIEVDEPDPTSGSLTSGSLVNTCYAYDLNNNLTGVSQAGSRSRSFTYDSLSRLTQASNPESGTISYGYDNNGNVQTKTDARNTTTYAYDTLNRLTGKSYSDGLTAAVKFGYDGVALAGCTPGPPSLADNNPIGNRTAMCDASGATSWSHDALGRVATESRTIHGATNLTKSITYGYNLDGSLASLTYPSGRIVTYTSSAAGRTLSAAESAASITYATGATYAPTGALSGVQLGGTFGRWSYNSRLQPLQIYATNGAVADSAQLQATVCPSTAATLMSRIYNFNPGHDNGNVVSIADCLVSARSQNFDYDSLNRLADGYSAGSTGTSIPGNWGENYTIDAWGNLTNIATKPGRGHGELLNCAATNVKNQLSTCYGYDAAGNLTSNGSTTYAYDAENRLKLTSAGNSYVYDGDGKRVINCVGAYPSCTTATLYRTGAGSDTLSETSWTGAQVQEYTFFNGRRVARRYSSANTVKYMFADHLRSNDLLLDSAGVIERSSFYYPFGGEVLVSGSGTNTYKFAEKERDAESGLDNFGARYYGSSLGRFMKPDDSLLWWDRSDPQSLNLYSYAGNNPVSSTDDGHSVTICDTTGHCNTVSDDEYSAAQQADKNNIAPSLSNLANSSTGTGAITNSSGGAVGTVQWTPDNPGIQTLGLAGQMAAPGVNFAAQGLRMFGYAFAASVMVAAECLAGAPSCTKGNVAMAILPEIGALREGTLLLEEGATFGKGAEILQKAGGVEQAVKDFESVQATESVYGSTRVKTLSDGSKVVLYQSTGGSGATTIAIQNAAGRTVTKIRY